MDVLYVNGIRAYGYVGVFPEEQRLGQWYQVDLTLWLDILPAAATDRLQDTLDYSALIQTIQALIQTSQFALIERLAETIAQTVLQAAKIPQVKVRLTKLTPPVPNFDGTVAIEITRSVSPELE